MNENAQRFVIVDLRIPFVRLVLFFVKAALAAIPAAIIVGFAAHAGDRPHRRPRPARSVGFVHDAALAVLAPATSAARIFRRRPRRQQFRVMLDRVPDPLLGEVEQARSAR